MGARSSPAERGGGPGEAWWRGRSAGSRGGLDNLKRWLQEHRADRLRGGGSVMGDLIAFRSQRPSGEARPSGAGAEILFFTGVRYQRMSEDALSSNTTPGLSRPLRPKSALPSLRPSAIGGGGTPLPNERRPSERMAQHDDDDARRSACERVFFFRPLRQAPRLDPHSPP
jgi:hypothetical protein